MLKQRFSNIFSNKKRAIILFAAIGAVIVAVALLAGINFNAEASLDEGYELADYDHTDEGHHEIADYDQYDEEQHEIVGYAHTDGGWYATDFQTTDYTRQVGILQDGIAYENVAELRARVAAEPRLVELNFDNISEINIGSILGNEPVRFEAGDRLTVRYYEWFDNQLDFEIEGGVLSISRPRGRFPIIETDITGQSIRHSGNVSVRQQDGRVIASSYGWFRDYLEERGQADMLAIVVTLPPMVSRVFSGSIALYMSEQNFESPVHFQSSSGSITAFSNTFNGAATFQSSSGTISLAYNELNDRAELITSSGSNIVNGNTFNGQTTLRSSSGLVGASRNNFNSEQSNISSSSGQILSFGNNFEERAVLSSSSGMISVDGCTFGQLEISTSSGVAGLALSQRPSNYNIIASTNASVILNGRDVEAHDLRNENAASTIIFSSSSGNLSITTP